MCVFKPALTLRRISVATCCRIILALERELASAHVRARLIFSSTPQQPNQVQVNAKLWRFISCWQSDILSPEDGLL
jgi:hypothetical protein